MIAILWDIRSRHVLSSCNIAGVKVGSNTSTIIIENVKKKDITLSKKISLKRESIEIIKLKKIA